MEDKGDEVTRLLHELQQGRRLAEDRLRISMRTVKRDRTMARAGLHEQLAPLR